MILTALEKQRVLEAIESWAVKMPDGYFGKISFDMNFAGGTLGTIQGGFTESIRVGSPSGRG